VTAEQRLTLTQSVHAPSQARAWVSAHTPHLPADAADDALLIASELVTNAVRHGEPEIVLALEVGADSLRIEVHDGGDELPAMPERQPDFEHTTGRGLLIVAATASDWGVVRVARQPGKTVWAQLLFGLHAPRFAAAPEGD
jgi:anti-sigma regulatory factor (Ser/Thr protein kinase)